MLVQQSGWLLGGGDGNDIVGTMHTTTRRGIAPAVETIYRAYNATGEVV